MNQLEFLSGYLADQIGRKKPYLICFFIQLVFGVATAYAPNFTVFCVFRVIVGGTYGAIYSLPFILGLEIVGPEHRATVSVLCSITYSLGNIGLAGIAYLQRSWQPLTLFTSAPLAIVGLAWLFVPERWVNKGGFWDCSNTLEWTNVVFFSVRLFIVHAGWLPREGWMRPGDFSGMPRNWTVMSSTNDC